MNATCILFALVLTMSVQISHAQRIYSVDAEAGKKNYVTYYDCLTDRYDTSFTFYGNAMGVVTIDPFNGRYFFSRGTNDTTNNFATLLCIDIGANSAFTIPRPQYSPTYISYDAFSNNLVFIESNFIITYNISTLKLDTPFVSPPGGRCMNDLVYAYNYVANELSYLTCDTVLKTRMVTVDISKKTVYNNPVSYGITNIIYDFNSNLCYAIDDTLGIVAIDPHTGQITPKYPFYPTEFLNSQLHMFNSTNGYYIAPTHVGTKLAFTDVYSGMFVKMMPYESKSNFQQLDGEYDPLVRVIDQTELQTVYGKSYQWYKDGQPILNATGQEFIPTETGMYKVEVTFLSDRTDFSKEIHFVPLEVKSKSSIASVKVYPNPFHDAATIDFNDNRMAHSFYLYNTMGQVVRTYNNVSTQQLKVNREELIDGTYYYRITASDMAVINGLLIVQ